MLVLMVIIGGGGRGVLASLPVAAPVEAAVVTHASRAVLVGECASGDPALIKAQLDRQAEGHSMRDVGGDLDVCVTHFTTSSVVARELQVTRGEQKRNPDRGGW